MVQLFLFSKNNLFLLNKKNLLNIILEFKINIDCLSICYNFANYSKLCQPKLGHRITLT